MVCWGSSQLQFQMSMLLQWWHLQNVLHIHINLVVYVRYTEHTIRAIYAELNTFINRCIILA